MPVLSLEDRFEVWAEWMRQNEEPTTALKADIRAAVQAADDWVEVAMPSFNTTLPLPSRTALSFRQKSSLLKLILDKRFLRS